MKSSLTIALSAVVLLAVVAVGARAQAEPPADQHVHSQAIPGTGDQTTDATRQSMMSTMKASQTKIDELVQKMNAAQGADKVDAMAALLTAMVDEQKMCRSMMANMSGDMGNMMHMMQMMGGMGGRGPMGSRATPEPTPTK
jgi:hypothetical protein